MWTYVQDTGAMFDPQGVQLEKGYAGKDPHKNHPDSQCVKDLGPIPRGDYRIRVWQMPASVAAVVAGVVEKSVIATSRVNAVPTMRICSPLGRAKR